MNLKERGITVGDLLIILLIIIISTILVKGLTKDKKTSINQSIQKEFLVSKDYLNYLKL